MSTRDARELCDLADVTVEGDPVAELLERLTISADALKQVPQKDERAREFCDCLSEDISVVLTVLAAYPALLESHARLLRAATGIVSVEIEMNLYDPNLAKYMDATAKVREAIAAAEKLAVRK
jgi:hypothetical protein